MFVTWTGGKQPRIIVSNHLHQAWPSNRAVMLPMSLLLDTDSVQQPCMNRTCGQTIWFSSLLTQDCAV